MHCAHCGAEVCPPEEAFTGDVCPQCQHFAHPTRLGVYEDLELIKRGGMGSVYRARHPKLGTTVAIKSVQTNTGPLTMAQRFEREASLAARIPHPGIVRVYDYDCQEGRLYLVMEFVEGVTLRQHIQEGGRDVDWCLDKVAQLADILAAAHGQGIVHRDIKPENVMVEPTGKVRLLDLGVSCVVEGEDRLTQPGEILGTPEYISPEQILEAPEAIDARADVYATGLLLYELLTGRSPFAGSNLFQVLKYVESLTPPPPSALRAGVVPELDEIVMECLAKDRDARPATAGALARRLRGLRSPEVVVVSRSGRGMAAGMMLVGALLGIGVGWAVWGGAEVRSLRAPTVAKAPPSPAERIASYAVSGDWPGPEQLLVEAQQIASGAPPAELFARGKAYRRCGALFLARRDFAAAAAGGHAPAQLQGRIHRVLCDKLVPALLGGPRWLQAASAMQPLDGSDHSDLHRGLAALQRNDYAAAERGLHASTLRGRDRTLLLGLCAFLSGDRRKAEEHLRQGEDEDLLHRLLAVVVDPRETTDRLRAILADVDRAFPLRYFLEAAIAMREGKLGRLRAATELALVTGEAAAASSVYLAARVWFAASFDAKRAPDLLAMGVGLGPGVPGAAVTNAMLASAAGDRRALAQQLAAVARDPDPTLAFFQHWQRGDGEGFHEAVLKVLHGQPRHGIAALRAWLAQRAAETTAEVELAQRVLAIHLTGGGVRTREAERLRASLLAAARNAQDFAVFRGYLLSAPVRGIRTDLLLDAVREGLAAGRKPENLLPIVQVAAELGADVVGLLTDAQLQPLHAGLRAWLPGGRDG